MRRMTCEAHDAPDVAMAGCLRVPAFTAASLTLGVLGHLWAGGTVPGPGTLLVLVGIVGLIGTRLAHRERRLPELVAAVALVQVAVHVALLDRQASFGVHSPTMTLAHAAAAVALAWWLRRGEAAFWAAAVRLLRRLTGAPVAPLPLPSAALRPPPDARRPGPIAGPGSSAWSVRGPPLRRGCPCPGAARA